MTQTHTAKDIATSDFVTFRRLTGTFFGCVVDTYQKAREDGRLYVEVLLQPGDEATLLTWYRLPATLPVVLE